MTTKEQIRFLQKNGEYRFPNGTRKETKEAATRLARAATKEDQANGIDCKYGIQMDAFGYYYTVVIAD